MTEAIWAVVPAAGTGTRMKAATPKQYLPLAGSCVLDITLRKLLALPAIAGVVVALAEADSWFTALSVAADPRLFSVPGGGERADSVLQALQYLKTNLGAKVSDWVLVHDAARPCVTPQSIEYLIQQVIASGSCGGILAVPVADTLKRVDAGHIDKSIDRRNLWQAQTPQMFRLGELVHALIQGLVQSQPITDEASALELQGFQPLVVLDRRDNIKITHPEDLDLAGYIVMKQMRGQE